MHYRHYHWLLRRQHHLLIIATYRLITLFPLSSSPSTLGDGLFFSSINSRDNSTDSCKLCIIIHLLIFLFYYLWAPLLVTPSCSIFFVIFYFLNVEHNCIFQIICFLRYIFINLLSISYYFNMMFTV